MCPLLLYVYQNGGPLKSELTECFVKARHRFLYMGANFNGDRCWGLRKPRLAGETCQLQIVFAMWYVQFSSVAQSCPTLCDPMDCSTPGLPVHHQLLGLAQTHVHRVSDAIHLILCRPLLLLPPIPPSVRVFSSESTLRMRWPKYWSFSFSISPSKEYPGLIFRMAMLPSNPTIGHTHQGYQN